MALDMTDINKEIKRIDDAKKSIINTLEKNYDVNSNALQTYTLDKVAEVVEQRCIGDGTVLSTCLVTLPYSSLTYPIYYTDKNGTLKEIRLSDIYSPGNGELGTHSGVIEIVSGSLLSSTELCFKLPDSPLQPDLVVNNGFTFVEVINRNTVKITGPCSFSLYKNSGGADAPE